MSKDFDELNGYEAEDTGDNASSLMLDQTLSKLRKKMDRDLISDLESLDEAGLRARIAQSDCNIHESEMAKVNDTELHMLLDRVKLMKSSYSEVKKAQANIIKYCTCLLDKAGKL